MILSNMPEKTPLTLGSKIRLYRKQKAFTLAKLAEQCDLSPSFLSQIERDQANPSVTTLYTIAENLGVPVASFFEDADQNNKNDQPMETAAKVVRADRRKILIYPGSGIRNELISPDLKRAIQMMRIIMPPSTDSGEAPFIHEGEECGIVLQGTLETWVGDEQYILGPGDAIYHNSTIPHRNRNIGDNDVIIIVAKTPPSF